jgi:hypothetical protein
MTGTLNCNALSYINEAVNAKSLEKEMNKNLYEFFIQDLD